MRNFKCNIRKNLFGHSLSSFFYPSIQTINQDVPSFLSMTSLVCMKKKSLSKQVEKCRCFAWCLSASKSIEDYVATTKMGRKIKHFDRVYITYTLVILFKFLRDRLTNTEYYNKRIFFCF